jgi:hypothetical protein
MKEVREKFLAERSFLFPAQRPFKFHYYNVTNFVSPDKHWEQSDKERCRKCKHIFLAVDEWEEDVSQDTFREQYTTFVGHLQKLMNDATFPIWLMTVNEPAMKASNCFSPSNPRSTDHPCNDVIKSLFRDNESVFPERVHLMDNTDITLAQFDSNYESILANIALRIFVAVGKGVAEWRGMGQQGLIDGLHRNGTVEPNFALIPYDGWTSP